MLFKRFLGLKYWGKSQEKVHRARTPNLENISYQQGKKKEMMSGKGQETVRESIGYNINKNQTKS